MWNLVKRGCSLALMLAVGACGGGGGGDNDPTPGTKSIAGAVPSAQYEITVSDQQGGTIGPVNPDANGNFIVNVTSRTGPFLIQAAKKPFLPSSAKSFNLKTIQADEPTGVLYGYANDAGNPSAGEGLTIRANVNQLTTLALAGLYGSNPAERFAKPIAQPITNQAFDAALHNVVSTWITESGLGLLDTSVDLTQMSIGSAETEAIQKINAWLTTLTANIDGSGNLTYVDPASKLTVVIPTQPVMKTVDSLQIAKVDGLLVEGTSVNLSVKAIFNDNSEIVLNPALVTYQASGGSSVDAQGVFTAGPANSIITVSAMGKTAAVEIAAQPKVKLSSISISPPSTSVLESEASLALSAMANFSDGTSQPNIGASWSVNDETTSTVDSSGLLTIKRPAIDTVITVTATWAFDGVSKSAVIQVHAKRYIPPPPTLVSLLSIEGALDLVNEGTQERVTVIGKYSDGSTAKVPAEQLTFAASNDASINAMGDLTVGKANTTLTASAKGQTLTREVKVKALLELQIGGVSGALNEGASAQLDVYGIYSNGIKDLLDPRLVTLTASNDSVIANGQLVAGSMDTTVTAIALQKTTALQVTVIPKVKLQALEINSAPDSALESDSTLQLNATAIMSNNTLIKDVANVVWTVSDESVASIDSQGLLKIARPESDTSITVTAELTFEGVKKSSQPLTIQLKRFLNSIVAASIQGSNSLLSGQNAQYNLKVWRKDGMSSEINATTWSVDNANATISGEGVLKVEPFFKGLREVSVGATLVDPLTNKEVQIASKNVVLSPEELVIEHISITGYQSLYTPQSASYMVLAHTANFGTVNITSAATFSVDNPSAVLLTGNQLMAKETDVLEQRVVLTVRFGDKVASLDVTILREPLIQGIGVMLDGQFAGNLPYALDTLYVQENTVIDLADPKLNAQNIISQGLVVQWKNGNLSQGAAEWSTDHADAHLDGQILSVGALSDSFEEFNLTAKYRNPFVSSDVAEMTLRVVVLTKNPVVKVSHADLFANDAANYLFVDGGALKIDKNVYDVSSHLKNNYIYTYNPGSKQFIQDSYSNSSVQGIILERYLKAFQESYYMVRNPGGTADIGFWPFEDGSIEISTRWNGGAQREAITDVEDLSGKLISSVVPEALVADIGLRLDPNATFGPGAKRIRLSNKVVKEGYSLASYPITKSGSSWDTPLYYASLEEFVIDFAQGKMLTQWWSGPHVEIVSDQVNADMRSGSVIFKSSYPYSESDKILGYGSWKLKREYGSDIFVLDLPEALRGSLANYTSPIFAMYSGKLYQGFKQKVNQVWTDPANDNVRLLNNQAIQDIQANLSAAIGGGTTDLPFQSEPVAPGYLRVHWRYTSGSYTENNGWGVYAWEGPLVVDTTWPSGRIKFTHIDGYGALVDIPIDTTKSAMKFLIINALGDSSKFANCGSDMSAALSPSIGSAGQEVWLKYGSCTVYTSYPGL